MNSVPADVVFAPETGDWARDPDRLLEPLRRKLLRTLLARGVEEHQAEDLVQEGLAIVWRKLPQLREPERLQSWARSILLNRLRSLRRRERPVEAIPLDQAGSGDDPLQVLILAERVQIVDRLLGSLRPEHRLPISLRHGQGLSPETTCRLLGISRASLRRRLHAGLARLRQRFARRRPAGETALGRRSG